MDGEIRAGSQKLSLPNRMLTHPSHRRHPSRLGGKPDNIEYSDDDDDEGDGVGNRKDLNPPLQMTEEQERRLGRLARAQTTRPSPAGPSRSSITEPIALPNSRFCRPEPVAPPLSPRTTRRNMLANEMTESVRRNLLWERQMRAQALGILVGTGIGGGFSSTCVGDLEGNQSDVDVVIGVNKHKCQSSHASSGANGQRDRNNGGLDRDGSSSNNVKKLSSNKQYRNFSKGFHRSGW